MGWQLDKSEKAIRGWQLETDWNRQLKRFMSEMSSWQGLVHAQDNLQRKDEKDNVFTEYYS